MSSIIFDGNTYTFGATVSANPGTGTTSYVFTSLTPGSTYGFIIWAFNGFGSSPITGPVTKVTLTDEFREEIVILSWGYPGVDFTLNEWEYDYAVKNPENLISPSQPTLDGSTSYINQMGPRTVGGLIITPGFTAPDGSTSASEFRDTVGTGFEYYFRDINGKFPAVPSPGLTYYFSFWQNTSLGKTFGNAINVRGFSSNPDTQIGLNSRQIYPTIGSQSQFPAIVYPTGSCGWVRFVFQSVAITSGFPAISANFNISSTGTASGFSYYFWGIQLERGDTFPQSRYDAGISDYKPNILASSNQNRIPLDYSIVNTSGITVWNTDPDWVGNWNIANGITYLFPNIELRFGGYEFTANDYLTKGTNSDKFLQKLMIYLKKFPEKYRAIRPFTLEEGGIMFFSHYDDAITGTGFINVPGTTYAFYDSNYNLIVSNTGYIGSVWPVAGISASRNVYQIFYDAFSATGASLGYVLMDYEGIPWPNFLFERGYSAFGWTASRAIVNDPRYRQSWNGVTSLNELMESQGATFIDMTGSVLGDKNFLSWARSINYQTSKAYELAYEPFYELFPNASIGNYGYFNYNGPLEFAPLDANGVLKAPSQSIGQVGQPVLYGEIGLIYDQRISGNDNTSLEVHYPKKNKLINSENLGSTGFNYFLTGGTGFYPVIGITSPFNNSSVGLIKEDSSLNSSHGVRVAAIPSNQPRSIQTGVSGTNYVFSCYLKKPDIEDLRYAVLSFDVELNGYPVFTMNRYSVVYDLLTGLTTAQNMVIVGCGYTSMARYNGIEDVGNSWYRCWISDSGNTNNFYVENGVWGSNSATPSWSAFNRVNYNGSGVSGFYLWGTQFETGTAPTSYEKTVLGTTFISDLSLPWVSFILSLAEVRAHRRSAPSIPIIPWIGDASWTGTSNTTSTRPYIGFSDSKIGFNPRTGDTYTQIAGNSAYYYEMIRHAMLYGTKAISHFPGFLYADARYPGFSNYMQNGNCGWYYELKQMNDTVKEVNNIIGGFTLTSAITERPSWLAQYLVSGAPGPRGTTWWWRVTVNPQYNVLVDGVTLDGACGPYGTWVSTTGPTLAHVPITILS
jgi:hypothetical protein